LIEYDYALKPFVREILLTDVYQRAVARPDEVSDARSYTHALIRRIPATQLLDCISQVTESPEKLRGLGLGNRAVQALDQAAENYFLTTFGRSQRASVCACETKSEPNLSQALHLINGTTVHGKIAQGRVIARLFEQQKSPEFILEHLYVRCLSRKPNDDERSLLLEQITSAEDQSKAMEDVFWAVLNSKEFLFNH
jgi:hypothetical protein